MAVPKMIRQNVLDALKYIDENGVPFHNQSTQYDLVSEKGKNILPNTLLQLPIILRMEHRSQLIRSMEQKQESI